MATARLGDAERNALKKIPSTRAALNVYDRAPATELGRRRDPHVRRRVPKIEAAPV